MPVDRFVVILAGVLAAAGFTVFLAASVQDMAGLPGPTAMILLPLALIAYVLVRLLQSRRQGRRRDGDHRGDA